MHDNDGFMVLMPKGNGSILSTPSYHPTSCKTIGDHKLIQKKRSGEAIVSDTNRFLFNGSAKLSGYTVEYKPKAWQNKAWSYIGRDINFTRTPAFKSDRKASKRLKHLVRIGVAIKIRACSPIDITKPNTAKPIIMQMAPKNNPYGIYVVGDTSSQITDIFEQVHDLMYNHVDEIISAIDKWGYAEAVMVMKAFLVYDDKSYDWVTGNPHKLFRLLGISFTKDGKVKL